MGGVRVVRDGALECDGRVIASPLGDNDVAFIKEIPSVSTCKLVNGVAQQQHPHLTY